MLLLLQDHGKGQYSHDRWYQDVFRPSKQCDKSDVSHQLVQIEVCSGIYGFFKYQRTDMSNIAMHHQEIDRL